MTVFRRLDLDLLIAVRTAPAPGGSYFNPVERIMSVLNLAVQGVALERKQMGDDVEKHSMSCTSMDDIRALAVKKQV